MIVLKRENVVSFKKKKKKAFKLGTCLTFGFLGSVTGLFSCKDD